MFIKFCVGDLMIKNAKNTVKLTRLDGLNNLNYLLSYDDKNYFLKCNFKDKNKNFSYEYKLLTLLDLNHICPKVIYKDTCSYTIISEFISNSRIDESTCTDPKFLLSLSNKLKNMHNLKCDYIYNPFNEIRKKLTILKKVNFKFSNEFIFIISKLDTIENILCNDINYGLCHNDLNPSNILYKNDEVFLIDFEFSGMWDIFYDIATFCWLLDDNSRKIFLMSYFNNFSQELHLKFKRYLFVVKLWNICWSYVKSFSSTSDYDYKKGGDLVLIDLYNDLKDDKYL